MVQQRSIEVEYAVGSPPALDCLLCGKDGIKFGSTICQGCKQEISYVDRVKAAKPGFFKDIVGGFVGATVLWVIGAFAIAFIFGEGYAFVSSLLFVLIMLGVILAYFMKRKNHQVLLMEHNKGRRLVCVVFGTPPTQYRFTSTSSGILLPLNDD